MLIPRKYYSSPTQFVLALLLIIAIIVNIIIYQLNHHSLPTGAYTPDGNIASAESYLLKPGSSVQSWINDVYNPEFWDSFAAELKTEKANEILLQLKTSVKKTHYQELLDELRETIRKEKYEEFTTQLMSQIQHQYTENYIRTVTNSYSLFEELKQEYLESHEKEIKDELLNELSNNENSVDTKLDKKSYYKYILKDLLLANGPSRSPITNQELADIDPIHVGNPELFSAIPKMGLNSLKMKDLSDAHEIVTKLLYNLQAPPFFKGDGIVILLSSDPSSSFDESIAQVMLNIKQIRNLGAKLPIEVVFPNNDIDARIQHYLQDNFDVKCLSIEKEIGSEVYTEILLQREVALNPIALLISSFDNIITIHSQSIPVQNVDDLLSKKTFLNTKWLFWANTWGRTTSQAFYNIAKLNIGEISRRDCLLNDKSFADYINDQKANCLHDLEGIPEITTVESSQMVFSKRFHYRSFLLSIYYNIFGRSHFYKLLYLNSDPTYKKPFNNNDRETYIPALHFFKELYHLMSYLPEFLESPQKQARFDGDTGLSEIALIQHDPTDIDQFFAMWKNWLSNQNLDSRILPFQKNSYTSALFERFLQETNAYHPGRDSKQDIETKGKIATTYHVFPKPFFLHFTNDFRLYVKSNSNRILDPSNFSQDWEKEFLVITKWLACDVLQDQKYWKDFQGNHDACQEAQQYIQIL